LIIFDLLDIPVYHGWLVDPVQTDISAAIGDLSYNQLMEFIVNTKHPEANVGVDSASTNNAGQNDNAILTGRVFTFLKFHRIFCQFSAHIIENFLNETQTQLTYYGLSTLLHHMRDGELGVFFRNNHFSTIVKEKVREEFCHVCAKPTRPLSIAESTLFARY
jgi:hypothetical protein